jgi:hypothetical protein
MFANTVTIFIVIQLAPMLMWPARASIQAGVTVVLGNHNQGDPGFPPRLTTFRGTFFLRNDGRQASLDGKYVTNYVMTILSAPFMSTVTYSQDPVPNGSEQRIVYIKLLPRNSLPGDGDALRKDLLSTNKGATVH